MLLINYTHGAAGMAWGQGTPNHNIITVVTQCAKTTHNANFLMIAEALMPATAHCFTLSQVVFSLPIAFLTSLEGSVIEMKPATPVPVDITVKPKS